MAPFRSAGPGLDQHGDHPCQQLRLSPRQDGTRQISISPRQRNGLTATAVLGAAFISSQLLAWLELSERGLYFAGNPYAGFFYILTAVHALHVLGGVIALGLLLSAHGTRIIQTRGGNGSNRSGRPLAGTGTSWAASGWSCFFCLAFGNSRLKVVDV